MDEDDALAAVIVAAAVIAFFLVTGITSYTGLISGYDAHGVEPFLAAIITIVIALVAIYLGEDGKWVVALLSIADVFITFSAILN